MTLFQPSDEKLAIYDAAMKYIAEGTPTIVFGGEEYGTGSSRDWAAKGTQLLGVKAVVVRSFERIHRSNLVGMGVLPLQFKGADSVDSLGIKGDETFDLTGLEHGIRPMMDVKLTIHRKDGSKKEATLLLRIDTPIEVDYFLHGGILPYVLRDLVAKSFERIHRSNLVGMGVLPCQFKGSDTWASLGIKGDETFDITGTEAGIKPQMDVKLTIHRRDGTSKEVPLLLRIDTPIEVDYYLNGGILPFVLRELMTA